MTGGSASYRAQHQDDFAEVDVNPPVAVAGAHLLDSALLTPAQADRKHLAQCGWCRQRQRAATQHGDSTDEEEFLQAARTRAVDGGAASLASLTLLAPEVHALAADTGIRSDVMVGRLWRLRWQGTTELAVVVKADGWWMTVAPVTTDVTAADEFSLILPASASVLNIEFAVCVSLETTVPLYVFDCEIAPARAPIRDGEESAHRLPSPETIRDVWRAWRRDIPGPADLTYGTPVDEADLDRRELRGTIAEGFAHLASAAAHVPGDPVGDVVPLRQRINGLRPEELSTRSGLDMSVFVRIENGGRVTRSEAVRLAQLFGIDVCAVLDANPPFDGELIIEVSRPVHRPFLRLLAGVDRTEDEQRWEMAETVATQASRSVSSTSDDAPTDWTGKVAVYLQQRLEAIAASSPEHT